MHEADQPDLVGDLSDAYRLATEHGTNGMRQAEVLDSEVGARGRGTLTSDEVSGTIIADVIQNSRRYLRFTNAEQSASIRNTR